MKILILCTGNSCRSQMAHGFLKSFDDRMEVYSAGTEPAARVNPKAVLVMKEAGIDLSSHKPEVVTDYIGEAWDYVVTVCDHANEICPVFTGKVGTRLHMGFEDPSAAVGSEEYVLSEFRRIREQIRKSFFDFYVNKLKPDIT